VCLCVLSLLLQYIWYGVWSNGKAVSARMQLLHLINAPCRLPLQQVKVVGTFLPLFLGAVRRLVVGDGGSADKTWYGEQTSDSEAEGWTAK